MSVTYKNNWKNITTALMSKIKSEMKCPVFSDFDTINKNNHFIKLIPTGSVQGDVTVNSEHRTFEYNLHYYMQNRVNTKFQNYVFNQVSILEALIHDIPTLSLADNTSAYNIKIGDLELGLEPDEEFEEYYIAGWNLSCEHLSNLG